MTVIELLPFEEFRFELKEKQEIKIFVIEGNCEILGQELTNERWFTLSGMKSFLYTVKGCKFEIEGDCEFSYKSCHSNIQSIFNLFYELQKSNSNILVVGNSRSTFCSICVNLFSRIREKLLFTEIEPKTGNIVFPGVIASVLVDKVVDYQRGYEKAACIGYFYGDVDIIDKKRYFQILDRIKEKTGNMRNILLGPNDSESIMRIMELFGVGQVVVIGDERMYTKIGQSISNLHTDKNIGMTFINLSSGYFVNNTMNEKIHSYFYGKNNELTPFSLNFREQKIFSKKNEMLAPASALPLGSARRVKSTKYEEVEFAENYIMAAIDCEEEEDILISPSIAFFLGIEKESLRVLAPQSRLPKEKLFFKGNIKYYES